MRPPDPRPKPLEHEGSEEVSVCCWKPTLFAIGAWMTLRNPGTDNHDKATMLVILATIILVI